MTDEPTTPAATEATTDAAKASTAPVNMQAIGTQGQAIPDTSGATPKPAPARKAPPAPKAAVAAAGGSAMTQEAASAERDRVKSDLIWAARQILKGNAIRRRAWVGNKTLSASHAAGRVILENEDLLAEDWELV